MRVGGCHAGKGREQLADFQPIFLQPHAQLRPPRIFRQRIKRDCPARAVGEQRRLQQILKPEALIFKVAADGLRPVGCLTLGGQGQHGRNRL